MKKYQRKKFPFEFCGKIFFSKNEFLQTFSSERFYNKHFDENGVLKKSPKILIPFLYKGRIYKFSSLGKQDIIFFERTIEKLNFNEWIFKEEAETILKEKFNIKEFHNYICSDKWKHPIIKNIYKKEIVEKYCPRTHYEIVKDSHCSFCSAFCLRYSDFKKAFPIQIKKRERTIRPTNSSSKKAQLVLRYLIQSAFTYYEGILKENVKIVPWKKGIIKNVYPIYILDGIIDEILEKGYNFCHNENQKRKKRFIIYNSTNWHFQKIALGDVVYNNFS